MWPEVIKLGIEVVGLVRDVVQKSRPDETHHIKVLTEEIKKLREQRDKELSDKFGDK